MENPCKARVSTLCPAEGDVLLLRVQKTGAPRSVTVKHLQSLMTTVKQALPNHKVLAIVDSEIDIECADLERIHAYLEYHQNCARDLEKLLEEIGR